jgi:hypothetical protein
VAAGSEWQQGASGSREREAAGSEWQQGASERERERGREREREREREKRYAHQPKPAPDQKPAPRQGVRKMKRPFWSQPIACQPATCEEPGQAPGVFPW